MPFATVEEVDAAIQLHKMLCFMAPDPIQARMRIMLKLQDLIRANMKDIAQVLTAEQGKTLADAEGDIQRGLEVVEHACSVGTLQMGEYVEGVARGVEYVYLAATLGVCAGITPFNFSHDPALDVPNGNRVRQYFCFKTFRTRSIIDHDAG